MKLYDHPRAPSPRRVRIFLAEKGLEVPRETVSIEDGGQLQPAFLARNPAGTVPLLELDDGTRIGESIAICRYFEALQPQPSLFGQGAVEQATVEMWNRRVEFDLLLAVFAAVRNAHPAFAGRALPGPVPVDQLPALAERSRGIAERMCDWLDRHLAGQRFLAGERFSVADISLLVGLDFARVGKLRLTEGRPQLLRWHTEVSARPSATA
jgi:glutathione S-transferase